MPHLPHHPNDMYVRPAVLRSFPQFWLGLIVLTATGCQSTSEPTLSPAPGTQLSVGAASGSPTPPAPREPLHIYRSELQRATNNYSPAYLLAQLQPEPYRPTGQFRGWIITKVFPQDTALCEGICDLKIGDIIVKVNGSPIERPEQLSKLMSELPDAKELVIVRLTDDKLVESVYPIVDGVVPPKLN